MHAKKERRELVSRSKEEEEEERAQKQRSFKLQM
jgi:hypothetical protein